MWLPPRIVARATSHHLPAKRRWRNAATALPHHRMLKRRTRPLFQKGSSTHVLLGREEKNTSKSFLPTPSAREESHRWHVEPSNHGRCCGRGRSTRQRKGKHSPLEAERAREMFHLLLGMQKGNASRVG